MVSRGASCLDAPRIAAGRTAWLACKQDGWLPDSRSCDGHALLFAAGELRRKTIAFAKQAESVKLLLRPPSALNGADAGIDKRQFDVGDSSKTRKKVVGLEDEADAPVADPSQFVVVEAAAVRILKIELAGGGAVQQTQDAHEGRLARSRRPGD